MSVLKAFIQELRRRNVIRVGAAYAVVAWILVQIGEAVFPVFQVPDALFRGMIILLVLGFPVVLVLAWAFELTPEGVKREKDIDRSRSITAQTGRKLDRIIIVVLAVAVAIFAFDKFVLSEREPAGPAVSQASGGDSQDQSIAVLPFVNMSPDPEQEYFSDGISEELLNVLAQIPGLRVAARTSSFQFKGQNRDISEIAKQLNVDHVLEGSVRKSGDRLRITAQLIRADSGFHAWSETYDRQLTDIFAIQDEISNAIAEALKVRLAVGTRKGAPQGPSTRNVEAYETYLLGRHQLNQRTRGSIEAALASFRRAVSLDPEFAPAYADQAVAILLLEDNPSSYGDIPQEEAVAMAQPLVERALALAPERPEVLAAKGRLEDNKDNAGLAIEYYDRALALNPSNGEVQNWRRMALFRAGRPGEILQASYDSVMYDPLSKIALFNHGLMLERFGRKEEARATLERLRSLDESYGNSALGNFHANHGDLVNAIPLFYAALEASPDRVSNRRDLAEVLIDLGFLEEALKVFEKSHYDVAIASADFALATQIAEQRLKRSPHSQGAMGELLYAEYRSGSPNAVGTAEALWTEIDRDPNRLYPGALLVMAYVSRAQTGGTPSEVFLDHAKEQVATLTGIGMQIFNLTVIEAEIAALENRDDDAIAAIARAIDEGLRSRSWLTAPIFEDLQTRPEFLTQLERLEGILSGQREEVLAMLCGPDAIVTSWQAASATCAGSDPVRRTELQTQ